jgi:hypothetical protein
VALLTALLVAAGGQPPALAPEHGAGGQQPTEQPTDRQQPAEPDRHPPAGQDRGQPTEHANAGAAADRRPGIVRVVTGVWGWLAELWHTAGELADRRSPPTSTTTPTPGAGAQP